MFTLTIIFIIYEFFKIIYCELFWEFSQNRKKYPVWRFFEYAYLAYLILLFFSMYWYVGIIICIISLITAFNIGDRLYNNLKITDKMKNYLNRDGIMTILILSSIVYRELN